MANLCEVCGQIEDETMETSELMAETLHVCASCRKDRKESGAEEIGM
ncbi:hypothetical protein OS242_01485 [Tumebacillus sp. DT12]|uniref:GapA-binding peptide SR1P n=1 Tax=Tumebacillus lacus TaxID=2995335 RepID=A0ABT3WZ92_9BACL|nr:hypothetical protein [Tumebacillus lacus]MCX7568641.1 hypothetical protein [Tumebacillus lacus]